VAETLRLEIHELAERIERLGRPATPAESAALLGEVDAVLTRLERGLAQLSPPPAAG
jgi:hypothetical protein